jgi:hypothetical protein
MAGVSGKNDSVSLLWVTNHAFQSRQGGREVPCLYRVQEDYIVRRYSGPQVSGQRFHFSKCRRKKGLVGVAAWVGGPTLSDSGTNLPASGKDSISELFILTVVASTEGNDTAVL